MDDDGTSRRPKDSTVIRAVLAVLLLPGMVTVVAPCLILYATGGAILTPTSDLMSIARMLVGLFFIAAGLTLLITTVTLFARRGKGTLAPWAPPRKLVVAGVYRHVRNPMISGVLAILLGESILTGSFGLFAWFLFFLIVNLVYIPFSEESSLRKRFGADYETYLRNVPRWIPRVLPWEPGP